jgi:hypothetical protein
VQAGGQPEMAVKKGADAPEQVEYRLRGHWGIIWSQGTRLKAQGARRNMGSRTPTGPAPS